MKQYSPEKHILLADVAHLQCIYEDDEWSEFVKRVRKRPADWGSKTKIKPFLVKLPPLGVPRSPLVMAMSVTGDDIGAMPFDDRPWEGERLAVKRTWWIQNQVEQVAREMVNEEDKLTDPYRISYMWQVPQFDPERHIPLYEWCDLNGLDIGKVRNRIVATRKEYLVEWTVNPYRMKEEKEKGHFDFTCLCFKKEALIYFNALYLPNIRGSKLPEIPEWPGHDYDNPRKSKPKKPIKRRKVEMIKHHILWKLLKDTLNSQPGRHRRRKVEFFGGNLADKYYTVSTEKEVLKFLKEDAVDKNHYLRNTDKNAGFDCDNFATLLMARASIKGIACGVIHGDVHAFNFFVVKKSKRKTSIMFVEPQTDAIVESLEGNYSIKKRCAVYI